MKIKALELHNFCNIKHAAFRFQDGVNLLTGDNGSGKSSVLKAIAYGLIGRTEKTIEDYTRWGAAGFGLKLGFELGQKDHELSISYSGAKNEKGLKVGDEFYRGQDVLQQLSAGLDPAICRTAIFSQQGDLDIIYATPAERREILKKIYELGFETALEHVTTQMESLQTQISELTLRVAVLKGKEYPVYELQPLPCTLERFEEAQVELIALEDQIKVLKDQHATLAHQRKMYLDQVREKVELQEKLRMQQAKVQQLEQFEVNSALTESELEREHAKSVSAKEAELALLPIQRALPPDVLKQAQALVQTRMLELQTAQMEETGCVAKLRQASAGQCPICQRPFSAEDQTSFQQDLTKAQAVHAERELALSEARKQVETLELAMVAGKQRADLEASIASLKSQFEQNQQSRATIKAGRLQVLASEQARLAELIEQIEKIVLPDKGDLDSQMAAIESQLTALAITESQHATLISSYETITNINMGLRAKQAEVEQLRAEETKQIGMHESQIMEWADDLKEWSSVKDILKKDYPNWVLSQLIGVIEQQANIFLEKTYAGRYTVQLIETKNGIDLVYGPQQKSVMLASGAEKSLMNLGLKIGFARLSGLGVLFLDEVDAYCSEDIAEEVFVSLQDLLTSGYLTQVFVISHKESIKELLETQCTAKVFLMQDGEVIDG